VPAGPVAGQLPEALPAGPRVGPVPVAIPAGPRVGPAPVAMPVAAPVAMLVGPIAGHQPQSVEPVHFWVLGTSCLLPEAGKAGTHHRDG
jgi:hypothetical protein